MDNFIVEFAGLPGAGKTTIVNAVGEQFINKNIDFINHETFYSQTIGINGKIKSVVSSFRKENSNIRERALEILFNCVVKDKWKEGLRRVIKMCRYQSLVKAYNNNMIISEGIVQAVLELLDIVSEEKIEEAIVQAVEIVYDILTVNKNLKIVLCILEPECANNRIKARQQINNSVDGMNDIQRSFFLKKRYNNINLLLQHLLEKIDREELLIIETNKPLYESTQAVISFAL